MLFTCLIYSQKCSAQFSQSDTITLQLKWRNQFQFAGYYAAQLKGYYAEHKLNVKIISGGPGISPIDEVLNKKAHIGISDPSILLKNKQQEKLVVLATIMQSSGYCIISLKEKNILKPSDLIGKTVLVADDQGWALFKTILLKEGLDPGKVNVVERKLDSEEIENKKVDAVVTYITSQPQRLKSLGYQINVIKPEEYGVDFYGDILFTSTNFAYQDTRVTDAFIEASIKGWKYALMHENEIIDYILTLPDVKAHGTTRANLTYEAKEVKKLIMPHLVEVGHSNLGRWQYMLTLFQKLGIADKNISLKKFIYEPEDTRLSRWYLTTIYVALIVVVIIIVVMLINRRLRNKIRLSTAELRNEIKQRKLAEELANENKEQIELILNSSSIGLWELEIESKKAKFNQQFKEILGYSHDYGSAENFFEKIHPEDLKFAQTLFSSQSEDASLQKMIQFRIENAKGEYIYVLSSSKLLSKNQQPFKISGVILSIEELKRKELEVLKVSDELSRRNNELKKFAYITSHNLRAPIVNISSLSEMINSSSLDTENTLIFGKITESIDKLESTLNDLVQVVSTEGSESFLLEKIDLKETLQSVIEVVKHQNPAFDIEFNVDLKVNELPFSKHCFLSIALNLITNSIKFKAEGRKTIINIDAFQDDNYIVLKFGDNGIGIDLVKNEPKIFGLYQRLNPHIEGRGFGLFIVKSHMDTFNGKIEVESQLNQGTTFTLYFPKHQNF